MKFIKYAVGLVIALSVIPMIVIAVNKLDEPRLKTVEFEVVNVDDTTITFSDNTYNNLLLYGDYDVNDGKASNLLSVKLNDLDQSDILLYYSSVSGFDYGDAAYNDWEELDTTNIGSSLSYSATIGDKWEMTFEVSRSTPPLIKLLVGFAPLLFVGGVLVFMLNKRKFD